MEGRRMPKEKFVTPAAPCMWACLQQPNVSKNETIKPAFQIVLIMDANNKAHHELLEHIRNLHQEAVGVKDKDAAKKKGHYPIKPHVVDDEVQPDKYEIRFKTQADLGQYGVDSIPTFDAHGQKIYNEKNFIANGSRVRVSWSYGFYDQAGNKGVSLYLNGVQVIELIEWAGHTAEGLGFSKQEGYVSEDKSEIQAEAEGLFGPEDEIIDDTEAPF